MVVSLSRSLWSRYRRVGRLEELQTEVTELEEEDQQLKQQKVAVESEEFLEREARDKLQMVKPGEKIVILPENVLGEVGGGEVGLEETVDLEPNWKRWYKLFFE